MAPTIYFEDGSEDVANEYMSFLTPRFCPLQINVNGSSRIEDIMDSIESTIIQKQQTMHLHRALVVHGFDERLRDITQDNAELFDQSLLNISDSQIRIIILVADKRICPRGWDLMKYAIDPPKTTRYLTGEE